MGCCRVPSHGNHHGWLRTCDNERNVPGKGDVDPSTPNRKYEPIVDKRVEPYSTAAVVPPAPCFNKAEWRKKCGCLRTSQKLKQILEHFPQPPPPPPTPNYRHHSLESPLCGPTYCSVLPPYELPCSTGFRNNNGCPMVAQCDWSKNKESEIVEGPLQKSRINTLIADLVQIVQITVTLTALALYYLIYCYMQLIYCTLSSMIFFLRADGPMKVTIGVVTITSLVVGFHLVLRLEKMLGIR